MIVIGINTREGVFEGRPYNNVYFHCTEPFTDDKAIGEQVKSVKVRYSLVAELMGKLPKGKDFEGLIGKEVSFFYNEFKNVIHVNGLV